MIRFCWPRQKPQMRYSEGTGLHLDQALGLLLGCRFQAFEILKSVGEVGPGGREFALDFLESGAQIFAPCFDGAQEGRERQVADIGIASSLFFARDIFVQIGKLAVEIDVHGLNRGDAALHFVDLEAFQAQQCICPIHPTVPSAPPRMPVSAT